MYKINLHIIVEIDEYEGTPKRNIPDDQTNSIIVRLSNSYWPNMNNTTKNLQIPTNGNWINRKEKLIWQ